MAGDVTADGSEFTKKYVLDKIMVGGEVKDLEVNAVPLSRTVNRKPLSSNINLTAADVGAQEKIAGVGISYDKATKTLTIKEGT